MLIAPPIRCLALAATLAVAGPICAQTLPATAPTLPATAPTLPAAAATLPATAAPPPQARAESKTPSGQAAHRALVTYDAGLLTVASDNSSLNQILRDIARVTEMKITGGVNDERVFGTYGPSDVSTILANLLRGTGSNMLIIEDSAQRAQQLVLTPRQGGVTPPNPSASRGDDEPDLPPNLINRQNRFAGRVFPGQTPPLPQPSMPRPPVETPPTPISAPAADTTTQQSPNGVKTPQQIYDQLMKLQQQQPKQPQ